MTLQLDPKTAHMKRYNEDLRARIEANNHEIYVCSIDEFDRVLKASPFTTQPIQQAWWSEVKENILQWSEIKGKVQFTANYVASGKDIQLLQRLISDLGGLWTKVYVKSYGGNPHIILKGSPGLKKDFDRHKIWCSEFLNY